MAGHHDRRRTLAVNWFVRILQGVVRAEEFEAMPKDRNRIRIKMAYGQRHLNHARLVDPDGPQFPYPLLRKDSCMRQFLPLGAGLQENQVGGVPHTYCFGSKSSNALKSDSVFNLSSFNLPASLPSLVWSRPNPNRNWLTSFGW